MVCQNFNNVNLFVFSLQSKQIMFLPFCFILIWKQTSNFLDSQKSSKLDILSKNTHVDYFLLALTLSCPTTKYVLYAFLCLSELCAPLPRYRQTYQYTTVYNNIYITYYVNGSSLIKRKKMRKSRC